LDLYETLGVRSRATHAELTRAFEKLARRFHPDLNPGDRLAASRYAAALRAFEILSDPARRAAYDRGELSATPAVPAAEVGFEGFDFGSEVRAEMAGFEELFEGGASGRVAPSGPEPGSDQELTTQIRFDEAFAGTERRVNVVRQDHCPVCRGAGDVATEPVRCAGCEGTGHVRARRGHMVFRRRCQECDGTGTVRRRPCSRCQGEGRLTRSEWLDFKIPAGVESGSQLKIPGGGNAGRRGGPSGDLILKVEVEAHPFFARSGPDLTCIVPLTMAEAALGGPIEVPTPEGSLTIEVPAGTQTGQRFRLRGRGMPRLGGKGRGDLYVEARVVVPQTLDARGRALLEELARLGPENPRADLLAAAATARPDGAGAGKGKAKRKGVDGQRKTVSH
jgi:molecular chaperone DnaJ